ncbi:MAG TPA: acetamidase/formamidase family protein [Azospirillaceae bacterium]|nr:acetamidase/formamidase family protein [Azospirillaceae bacterium]
MVAHRLEAGPATVHWGTFDARHKPVLTVRPGDQVTLDSVSGTPANMPGPPFEVPEALRRIHAELPPGPGHILTGPVAIEGAEPGDTLEVRILDVQLAWDWGYNASRPLGGALPDDFDEWHQVHLPIDRANMTSRMPWGVDLPLRPFFGVMGVAPPPAWREITSIAPRRHGGNLDNKELGPGATLYLPVHVPGALFSAGDGHAVQGDGEVNLTAIETGLVGTFEFHVRKGQPLDWPRAETRTHFITMAFDPDLDNAMVAALRDMIALIRGRSNLSAAQAYMLCSLACDLRITQVVNQNKGVHAMLPKAALHG